MSRCNVRIFNPRVSLHFAVCITCIVPCAQDALPEGKHSTFGVGKTIPDRKDNHVLENGAVIPKGKGVDSGVKDTSLL